MALDMSKALATQQYLAVQPLNRYKYCFVPEAICDDPMRWVGKPIHEYLEDATTRLYYLTALQAGRVDSNAGYIKLQTLPGGSVTMPGYKFMYIGQLAPGIFKYKNLVPRGPANGECVIVAEYQILHWALEAEWNYQVAGFRATVKLHKAPTWEVHEIDVTDNVPMYEVIQKEKADGPLSKLNDHEFYNVPQLALRSLTKVQLNRKVSKYCH